MSALNPNDIEIIIDIIDSLILKIDALHTPAINITLEQLSQDHLNHKSKDSLIEKLCSYNPNEALYSLSSLVMYVSAYKEPPDKIELLKHLSNKLNSDSFARLSYTFFQIGTGPYPDLPPKDKIEFLTQITTSFCPLSLMFSKDFFLYVMNESYHTVFSFSKSNNKSLFNNYIEQNHLSFWTDCINAHKEKLSLSRQIDIVTSKQNSLPIKNSKV